MDVLVIYRNREGRPVVKLALPDTCLFCDLCLYSCIGGCSRRVLELAEELRRLGIRREELEAPPPI